MGWIKEESCKLFSDRGKRFFFVQNLQTGYEAHPASYSVDELSDSSFPEIKAAGE
jgi:hypothetical protein